MIIAATPRGMRTTRIALGTDKKASVKTPAERNKIIKINIQKMKRLFSICSISVLFLAILVGCNKPHSRTQLSFVGSKMIFISDAPRSWPVTIHYSCNVDGTPTEGDAIRIVAGGQDARYESGLPVPCTVEGLRVDIGVDNLEQKYFLK